MSRFIGRSTAVLALLIAGCSTTLKSIPADFAVGAGEESVVIGHVTIDMGGPKPIEFFDKLDRITLTVEGGSSGQLYDIVCDETGSDSDFYVALPPGQYSLSKVDKGNMTSSLSGRFTVPASQVVYVGTLKFSGVGLKEAIAYGVLSGQSGVPGNWRTEDEFEKTVAVFRDRYPQIKQSVVKSLAVVDR